MLFRKLSLTAWLLKIDSSFLISLSLLALTTIGYWLPDQCFARDHKVIPAMKVQENYNDNIFFTAEDPSEDWITILSPSLTGLYHTERARLSLNARIDTYYHKTNDALDNTDQRYNMVWNYALKTWWELNLDVGYQLDALRERDLEETGLITDAGDRARKTAALTNRYQMNELASLTLDYNYTQEDYDDPQISDYSGHTLSLSYQRRLRPKIDGFVVINTARYIYSRDWSSQGTSPIIKQEFSDDRQVDYYALSVGFTRHITEQFDITMHLGGRYSISDDRYTNKTNIIDSFGQTQTLIEEVHSEDDSWAGLGRLELTYTGETSHLAITVAHDLYPASGRNGTTERTNAGLTVRKQLSSQWYTGTSLKYFLNRSDHTNPTQEDIDETNLQVRPFMRCEFGRHWSLETSYQATWIQDRQQDTERQQNVIAVYLRWQYPLFE